MVVIILNLEKKNVVKLTSVKSKSVKMELGFCIVLSIFSSLLGPLLGLGWQILIWILTEALDLLIEIVQGLVNCEISPHSLVIDSEEAVWINDILHCFWSNFAQSFVSVDLKRYLNYKLAQGKFTKSFRFVELDPGPEGITIPKISSFAKKNALILDFRLVAKLKTNLVLNVGKYKLQTGLKSVSVCGVFRAILEPLMRDERLFGHLLISAIQSPFIDYTFTGFLKPLNYCKAIVRLFLSKTLVHPNAIKIQNPYVLPYEEQIWKTFPPTFSPNCEGTLSVIVIEAESKIVVSPMVNLQMSGEEHVSSTSVGHQCNNWEFNEEFVFDVNNIRTDKLSITLLDIGVSASTIRNVASTLASCLTVGYVNDTIFSKKVTVLATASISMSEFARNKDELKVIKLEPERRGSGTFTIFIAANLREKP